MHDISKQMRSCTPRRSFKRIANGHISLKTRTILTKNNPGYTH